MSGITRKGDKMDVWGELWPSTPKVHERVVTELSYRINENTPFSTIWTMVELAGKMDYEDVLVTARALRDLRNEWRLTA